MDEAAIVTVDQHQPLCHVHRFTTHPSRSRCSCSTAPALSQQQLPASLHLHLHDFSFSLSAYYLWYAMRCDAMRSDEWLRGVDDGHGPALLTTRWMSRCWYLSIQQCYAVASVRMCSMQEEKPGDSPSTTKARRCTAADDATDLKTWHKKKAAQAATTSTGMTGQTR